MSSHTPGPWVVRKGDEWTRDVVTDHGEMPDGSRNYWNVASANIRRDECEANARLIAAAPDLLEALGQTLNAMIHLELSDSSKIEWEASKAAAYAAIAKATGGAA